MLFNNLQKRNVERLQNVLISDKQFSPAKVERVLRCDAFALLSNYCTLQPQDVSVKVEVEQDGTYDIQIQAKSDRLKIFGSLPEDYR